MLALVAQISSLASTPRKSQIKSIQSHYRDIEKVNSKLLLPHASKTNGKLTATSSGRLTVTGLDTVGVDPRRFVLDKACSSLLALLFLPFLTGVASAFFGSDGGSTFHSQARTPNSTCSGFLWALKLLDLAYLTKFSCSQDLT